MLVLKLAEASRFGQFAFLRRLETAATKGAKTRLESAGCE